MTASDVPHQQRPFLIRHGVDLLTVGMLLFVLQTGTIPFDFSWQAADGGVSNWFLVSGTAFTFPDVISNLFLYLPLGACLYWSIRRRLRLWIVAALLAVLVATALSAGIEWFQAYSPSRVSSLVDLTCNMLGAALGALAASMMRWILPRFLESALVEFADHPAAAVTASYVGLLIFLAAMPFSLSLDPGLFHKSLKSSYWIPFASVRTPQMTDSEPITGDALTAHNFAKWRAMKRWSRWAAETASFVLLVWLLFPVLRRHYKFESMGSIAMTVWLCALLAGGLSAVQLFSVTRDFDVTDLVFRMAGTVVGLMTCRYVMQRQAATRVTSRVASQAGAPRLVKACCACAVAYILYTGVIPLTFSARTTGLWQSLNEEAFWPFIGYFVTRFDVMVDDAMEKVGAYALFGAMLVLSWPRLRTISIGGRMMRLAVLGAVVSVPIEIVQAYIPIRITSLTDPILAAGGMCVGVLALEYVARFYRLARLLEAATPRGTDADDAHPSGASALDTLLGDLLEPHVDAPAEPGIREPARDAGAPQS